ncbi:WYL domain-containing protein [bacterium SCSIO 12643]|nr:WYL domain-containing protein [bacterium SCSIO 12643]
MPANRNALVRYKTIDKCLQNRYRQWTLDDLIDACSDALYDHEGILKGVSKRTIQADIQLMRSDKLGYNAPIIVIDKKYYTYEDKDYSITNIPITDQDLNQLNETIEFLRQFKGFSHFKELDGMVQKLEDHVYAQKTNQKPVIDFEKNDNLKGLEFLDELYQSIIKKKVIKVTYQSFKARNASSFDFHPYLLKEFRNRWFLFGSKNGRTDLLSLALDRMIQIEKSESRYREHPPEFDPSTYFKDSIGVSVSPNLQPERVMLYITRKHAPYVLTKPFHSSQKLIEQDDYGITISLDVQHNFELEKDILGLGDGAKVIAPRKLRRNIQDRLQGGLDLYHTEISKSGLDKLINKLRHKGFDTLNYVYSKRELRHISRQIDKYFAQTDEPKFGKRTLLKDIPNLKPLLINKNLLRIVRSIDPDAFITKAIYFDKPADANWYVTWHQDVPINVNQKMDLEGYSGWTYKKDIHSVCPPEEILKNTFTIRIHLDDTDSRNGALKIVPGSQNKRLSDTEIKTITENSVPYLCEVLAGGIQLMKPLLLHSSSKSEKQKRRVIHLEFSSSELPDGLEWLERERI